MSERNAEPDFVVVGSRPWSRLVFEQQISKYPGRWHFIESREDLRIENIQTWQPRYLFFLHWSWKVPEEIINSYECVCFHMTDVPFGRGGSPLQNLIQRGYRHTKVTALRMTEEFDAGPVYLKEDLCLEGNAEEIFIRATHLCARMIGRIISEHPTPVAQSGDVIVFKRRKPQESEIPALPTLQALHDFLRMLDADGYPKAFLVHAGFRYEFTRAALYDGRIVADVKITRVEEQPS